MKINGLIEKARYEHIACSCGKEVIDSFPIKDCLSCKFRQRWDSVPQKDFTIQQREIKDGKFTGKTNTKKITELTLIRGNDYQDVIGWLQHFG